MLGPEVNAMSTNTALLKGPAERRPRTGARDAAAGRLYDPGIVEPLWQEVWDERKVFRTPDASDTRKKFYVLDMFPCPSGAGLHVGHPVGYTATDVVARMMRM